ncbi:hypothetical protein PENTCL1PPCAC_682, partial [Pristionchus entomophagus]
SGSISSLFVMSLERLEAFVHLSTYESSSVCAGAKLIGLHIFLTLFGVFTDTFKYDFPTRVAHCTVVSVAGQPYQTVLNGSFFLSALFSIYLYTKLLKRNEYLQKSGESQNMSLSERYQLSENTRVLRVLLPIVVFSKSYNFSSHTSITIAGSSGFFYFEFGGFQKAYYPIFEVEMINMVYLQGIAMPLIFLYRYKNKRRVESVLFTANAATGEELIAVYDRAITKGW